STQPLKASKLSQEKSEDEPSFRPAAPPPSLMVVIYVCPYPESTPLFRDHDDFFHRPGRHG
ncbi:hypothetical protein, partial [Chelativorans composti]|uniref:hypothetical protein n=1 Tax=Chelativorans composti TaxID=768533 RepID=UPI0031EE4C08